MRSGRTLEGRIDTATFSPPPLLRNPHVQTILASSKLRIRHAYPVVRSARSIIFDAGGGVRLLGWFSVPPPDRPVRGIVIILHGWEGSASSTYCLRTGDRLYRNDYAVFRLNFRDHGSSHDLNTGLFYASALDEVFQAVRRAAGMLAGVPAFIVGFSLGGNFALRIARRCRREPIDNLRHVVCISPVLDPEKATARIDTIPYIRVYFLKKWRRSLRQKQALYPLRYDFKPLSAETSVRGLTDALLAGYSDFSSTRAYFKTYTLLGDALHRIPLPLTLLTAADDPIIAVEDFEKLRLNRLTRLSIQRHGGHNGFIDGFDLHSWYEPLLVELFDGVSRGDLRSPDTGPPSERFASRH
ncbi:MAG: alpha/beta fold hydrolase [Desulfobacterales bacterium]